MIHSIIVLTTTLLAFGRAVPVAEWTTIEMQSLNANRVPLAPETGCGIDNRYAFGAYRGTSNNLVIQFQGGGICSDKESCIDNIGSGCSANRLRDSWSTPERGMMSKTSATNPLRDWNHIFLPYCTCDFFYGDQRTDLSFGNGEEAFFNFKGYTNGKAAWQWVKAHYSEEFGQDADLPDRILVTGCSAGGYGASAHISYIAEDLKDTDIKLLLVPDSSYGVVDYLFRIRSDLGDKPAFDALFGEGIRENPSVKEWAQPQEGSVRMTDLHLIHANKYENLKIATFGFESDFIIRQDEEQKQMSQAFAESDLCNVNSWVVGSGFGHCVINSRIFYSAPLPSGNKASEVIGEFAKTGCTTDDLPNSYGDTGFTRKTCSPSCGDVKLGDTPDQTSEASVFLPQKSTLLVVAVAALAPLRT